MNGIMIIPTGIGATIGGHAGDATPAAKLMAVCCDRLIVHPNVVNASDINEMTDNMLYVEGSILDDFLAGEISLKETRKNKILVVTNRPVKSDTINAVSAARVTIGVDADILVLDVPLRMVATIEDGEATGDVFGWEELIKQVAHYDYDALAIHTPIEVGRDVALNYFEKGGVNPWGGVEAKASRLIAKGVGKPVAHAPVESVSPEDEELYFIFNKVVHSRIAPEAISNCYLHCVLKGLHSAPRIVADKKFLNIKDIDFLITPDLCYGTPHMLCENAGIPVIVVKENKTIAHSPMPGNFIYVSNYLEAAGVIMAMKSGVTREAVSARLEPTKVLNRELT
jgi:hypothetical protein